MPKYELINGWTKEKMKQTVLDRNDGTRCEDPNQGGCAYSDGKGNHCAVGCFIPDGHKGMAFEDGVSDLLKHYPDLVEIMPLDGHGLDQLQEIHDYKDGDFSLSSTLDDYRKIESTRERMLTWIDDNVVKPTDLGE